MKKISVFMASLVAFVAIALSFGPTQQVQAFAESEINFSEYDRYSSSKAGASISFYMSLSMDCAESMDITGWKAALCPANNKTLDGAVAVFDLSNENKIINTSFNYACVSLYTSLATDIPEGMYDTVIFDAAGNMVFEGGYPRAYINKTLVSMDCDMMNNDGYAYAYVYSESPALNAGTYPTFYAADKATAVTSFSDYTTEVNEGGYKVHIYRLNILDQAAFTLDAEGLTWLYYKMGTPNVSVSGNDAANDGGIGLYATDAQGFGYTYAFNLNNYIEKYNLDYTAVSPFDNISGGTDGGNAGDSTEGGSTDGSCGGSTDVNNGACNDNSGNSDTHETTTTVNGQNISLSVGTIGGSDNPQVQTAINDIVRWTNQISSQPSQVVSVLNQYAPSMRVNSVVAGGTLDISINGSADISSGARITFTDENIAANVTSGDRVIVLHVKHDGTIEYVPAVADNGSITATFTSLSPVAWFKVTASDNANMVSPKTGFSFWDFLIDLFW